MTTLSPAPPEFSTRRAQDILQDIRRKREALIKDNPSLQKTHHNHQYEKPPTVPDKSTSSNNAIKKQRSSSKNNKTRNSSAKSRRRSSADPMTNSPGNSSSTSSSMSRAEEIRADMKMKRASLTAVLEHYKNNTQQLPLSPSKRSTATRSLGVSTAPTAASTRSWVSSSIEGDEHDDQASFCYSETSLDDESPRESSIEFIIETDESDLYSMSTREEVEQAIDTIYKKVVPRALASVTSARDRGEHAASWVFRSQSSARDLYREESVRDKVRKKKERRVKIMEKKYDDARSHSIRGDASFASASSSIDLRQVRKQRSRLQSLMDSVNELKDGSRSVCGSTRTKGSSSPACRHRHDDCSEGSSPVAMRSPSRTKSMTTNSVTSPLPHAASVVDITFLKEQTRRSKLVPSKSLASHYVIETTTPRKRSSSRKKKEKVKCQTPCVATTPDQKKETPTDASRSSSSSSIDDSPLSSPVMSKDVNVEKDEEESLLVTPVPSLDEVSERKEPSYIPQSSFDIQRRSCLPELTLDMGSQESSRLLIFTSDSKDTDDITTPQSSKHKKFHAAASVSELPVVLESCHEKSPSTTVLLSSPPSSPPLVVQQNKPNEHVTSVVAPAAVFTMEDIIREMNAIAAKLGKDGLVIPDGTILNCRHKSTLVGGAGASSVNDSDAESASGWTFGEPSDLSSCSFSMPPPRQDTTSSVIAPTTKKSSKRVTNMPDEESTETPEQLPGIIRKSRKAAPNTDITKRFCGGLYHLAVLSGMPACADEDMYEI